MKKSTTYSVGNLLHPTFIFLSLSPSIPPSLTHSCSLSSSLSLSFLSLLYSIYINPSLPLFIHFYLLLSLHLFLCFCLSICFSVSVSLSLSPSLSLSLTVILPDKDVWLEDAKEEFLVHDTEEDEDDIVPDPVIEGKAKMLLGEVLSWF